MPLLESQWSWQKNLPPESRTRNITKHSNSWQYTHLCNFLKTSLPHYPQTRQARKGKTDWEPDRIPHQRIMIPINAFFFFFLLLLTCINVYILSFLILSQCREYSIFTSWIGICSYFHNNIKQYFYDFGATSPSNKPFFASFIYFGKTLKSNLKTKAKGFNLI